MNEIIDILMRRDGMDYNSAYQLVSDVQDEIRDVIIDNEAFKAYDMVVDILQNELGLEPDYLDAFVL